MKEVERKLISELMKNSRRSDRQLARAVGVSQPTVSRLIKKLEKQGYIREYTMIPDFRKLGYQLLGLTLVRLKRVLTPDQVEKARELTRQKLKESRFANIMFERGMGLGGDGVLVTLYEDYASYAEQKIEMKQHPFIEVTEVDSFITSLDDKVRYLPLTMSAVAEHMLKIPEKQEKQRAKKKQVTVRADL
jgi:DNA-binding Lrp family transcriptional regulator